MEKYYFIEAYIPEDLALEIDSLANDKFQCQGVEEFSMDEPEVDELLGERSYSGGDVPESVIDEVDYEKTKNLFPKKYYFPNEDTALDFLEHIETEFKIKASLESAEVKDWNEEWRKSYARIDIDDKFSIIPEWEKAEVGLASDNLFIYPGQGFGTGSHETTFLCLKQFFKYANDRSSKTCLDFGCGSGILGLAARKLYSELMVDLYDIDKAALDNTIQNIELNELDNTGLSLYLPPERDKLLDTYDFVFANILQNVLLLEAKYLANSISAGGLLILSGLLKGQEQEVIERYKEENPFLEVLEISQKNDWVAVIMESE